MVIKNIKIVTLDEVIDKGYIVIDNGVIKSINKGEYIGEDKSYSCDGLIAFPGFIDVHIHGSMGIDFMDATHQDYQNIASSLYKEGVTSFLATTLTSDFDSLKKVCLEVNKAKQEVPSLLGLHLEGPYINKKYKGAQNEIYIREPDIKEFDELYKISGNNIKYISLAPELDKGFNFIKHVTDLGVVASAGHTDASFNDIKEAINYGLTNITHTHNAMSSYHHRNPGVVVAAMHFPNLYTEVITDGIHVCKETLQTYYGIVGPNRFMIVTDSLKVKHSDIKTFKLFGLDCEVKNNAAYLTSGPLAGSLLTFDLALRNMKEYIKDISLIDLMKISSYNASKSLHLNDRGLLEENRLADIVLLDESLHIKQVYKLGELVFKND